MRRKELALFSRNIVAWAESEFGFYISETRRPIVLEPHQRRILRHCFRADDDGKFPYDTVLYSAPKKSGKTTIAALVALWAALFWEPPNEILVVANDLEQAVSRVYKAIAQAVRLNPYLRGAIQITGRVISVRATGTTITALPSDYAGAAGANQGLVVFDELWAYTTERARRLYEELPPVPTRRNSVRLITTTAGWDGESQLLQELYRRGTNYDLCKGGAEPVPELADLDDGDGNNACWRNGRLFVYWDHACRMPWQTPEFLAGQRKSTRPNVYKRLWENRWTGAESRFVPLAAWDALTDPNVVPIQPGDRRPLYVGVDASVSRDCTALVAVTRNRWTRKLELAHVRIWQPRRLAGGERGGKPTVDLEATVAAELRRLRRHFNLAVVAYDPYQLASIALQLEREGLPLQEFPQTAQRAEADQVLYDLITSGGLATFPHPGLRAHVQNAVARETARGLRLDKQKASAPIDGVVALSMACHAALEAGKEKRLYIGDGRVPMAMAGASRRCDRTLVERLAQPEGEGSHRTRHGSLREAVSHAVVHSFGGTPGLDGSAEGIAAQVADQMLLDELLDVLGPGSDGR